jgi:hypothetical protein
VGFLFRLRFGLTRQPNLGGFLARFQQLPENFAHSVRVHLRTKAAQESYRPGLAKELHDHWQKPFLNSVDFAGSRAHGNNSD